MTSDFWIGRYLKQNQTKRDKVGRYVSKNRTSDISWKKRENSKKKAGKNQHYFISKIGLIYYEKKF